MTTSLLGDTCATMGRRKGQSRKDELTPKVHPQIRLQAIACLHEAKIAGQPYDEEFILGPRSGNGSPE